MQQQPLQQQVELVPVQLTLGSSGGSTLQDWLLLPASSTDADLVDLADTLVRDMGVPLDFRRPVTDAVGSQVADWVANVPPLVHGPTPRRELVRLDVVLGGSLRLRDQFWWDLHAASPTPEEFAAELCTDSGLEPCHGAAVAAAIRIELGKLRRVAPSNLPLPTPHILDAATSQPASEAGRLGSVYEDSCLRSPEDWQAWGPSLLQLNADEVCALQQQQQHLVQQRQQQVRLAQRAAQQQQADAGATKLLAQQAVVTAAGSHHGLAGAAAQQAQQPAQQRQRHGPSESDAGAPRRQLRARRGRASRLKELLRQEEEGEGEEHSSASGSGVERSKSTAAAGAGGGGSAASQDYQPDEDSLLQESNQEAEDPREEVRQSQRAPPRPRQRRRASGGAAVAGKAPAPVPPAAAAGMELQQQQRVPANAQALPTPQQQAMLPMELPGSATAETSSLLRRSLPGGLDGGVSPLLPYGAGGGPGGGGSFVGSAVGGGMVPPMAEQQQQQQQIMMARLPRVPAGAVSQPAGLAQQSVSPAAHGPPTQQVKMVGAAIVHYARELNMGEHKIRAMLSRTTSEQLSLFRTLHQLVQQARARQQEQLEAAMLSAQAGHQGSRAATGLPPLPAPAPGALAAPVPSPPPQQPANQPVSQYANLFSEMFD